MAYKSDQDWIKTKSTYKNWRKHDTNAKPHTLSDGGVMVNSWNEGLEIEFRNWEGKRINFKLNSEDAALLIMNIDRFYHKKEVKREDYPNLRQYT